MTEQERKLKDAFDQVPFDDAPDPRHCDALEQRLLDALVTVRPQGHSPARLWRIVMKSKITQLTTAAIIAIALLVPLSYGTNSLIRRLIGGSYGRDQCQGPFQLDRDIRIELQIGTEQQPQMVSAGTVRFFVEDGQIRGTLRCDVDPWPLYVWRTRVDLFDAQGDRLHRADLVKSNPGVQRPYGSRYPQSIRFSAGSADKVSQIQRFRVSLEATSPDTPTTPDAWVESAVLPVVHGRVTGVDDAPIAGAVVQIREVRQPGQSGIAAPNVLTDRQGFYSYDQIRWPYRVGALVYEPTPSGHGQRHQHRRWNRALEGTQRVDFSFDRFPVGNATLSGTATDPNGTIAREFTVDARLRIDWDDESVEYRYMYGHREPFFTSDGRFEIRDLAPGAYDVRITPTGDEIVRIGLFERHRTYVCQLQDGQVTTVGEENATEKVWFGRVLFEDGTPAVSESPSYKTQVVIGGNEYATGLALATVDGDGYFVAVIPDETMTRLQSGDSSLTVAVAPTHPMHAGLRGQKFPVEWLSRQRETAKVVTISRPKFYYGRVLYENGKPAVPPAAPWPGASVYVTLRDQRIASVVRGFQTPSLRLDEEGYFTAYLTDEQLKDIGDGHVQMRVMHPSYAEEMTSFPVGEFPSEMLVAERRNAEGYILSFAEMLARFTHVEPYLDSAYTLESLAAALRHYADAHNQSYPTTLRQLAAYTTDPDSLFECIEYFPPDTAVTSKPAETVLAYDRTLFEATGTTHVLFRDGHIEFCRSRRLEILGIRAPDPAISP